MYQGTGYPGIKEIEIIGVDRVVYEIEKEITVHENDPNPHSQYLKKTQAKHVHEQTSAASTWTINHSLPFYPNIVTVDATGKVILGEITYVSATQITVAFTQSLTGKAYLS